jgi:hypothetical protein
LGRSATAQKSDMNATNFKIININFCKFEVTVAGLPKTRNLGHGAMLRGKVCDVSKEPSAPLPGRLLDPEGGDTKSFKTRSTTRPTKECHIPEDLHLQHGSDSLNFVGIIVRMMISEVGHRPVQRARNNILYFTRKCLHVGMWDRSLVWH